MADTGTNYADNDDHIITGALVAIYVIVVCLVLFAITMGIIHCIRRRRTELANRAEL